MSTESKRKDKIFKIKKQLIKPGESIIEKAFSGYLYVESCRLAYHEILLLYILKRAKKSKEFKFKLRIRAKIYRWFFRAVQIAREYLKFTENRYKKNVENIIKNSCLDELSAVGIIEFLEFKNDNFYFVGRNLEDLIWMCPYLSTLTQDISKTELWKSYDI